MKDIPAFPHSFVRHPTEETYIAKGMTLRDYFASRAMQAELTVYEGTNWPRVAKQAYQMADAMMKAREE